MTQDSKFALAYIRTEATETAASSDWQKNEISSYAAENSYVVVKFVEHTDRPGNVYDFEWLTVILEEDRRIKFILVHSLDRFCSDFKIAEKLIAFLEVKYSIVFDTVIKPQPVSLFEESSDSQICI